MAKFRNFFFVEFLQEQFNTPAANVPPVAASAPAKVWSAKKDEIVKMWNQLQGNLPIYMTPVYHPEGRELETYGEDGIRISGSWRFIAGVLSRLKDLLSYENQNTRLRLIFRGVDPAKLPTADKDAFVFYINTENRSKGKAGRPRKVGLPKL